jgi:DNA-sulfur modification-associated
MHARSNELPTPLSPSLESLDDLDTVSGSDARPINVFIGHNLGHRVFTMSVPFMDFFEVSDVANNPEAGPVAQRRLDPTHSRKLAVYMLKGLVSAAMLRREAKREEIPETFSAILHELGHQPYFSLQPIVCTIRGISPGGSDIEGARNTTVHGETVGFKVFLSQRQTLWVIDGQHRRDAANSVVQFLKLVRTTGKYPSKTPMLFPRKGDEISNEEMLVWDEVYAAMRQYATISVEVHLGLTVEQERQLFHDLNQLGKRVDRSTALSFDSSNPITGFIKNEIVASGMVQVVDRDAKTWTDDTGSLALKDLVSVNAIAFLNKGNVAGATPAVIEPRQEVVVRMWEAICNIPGFGEEGAKVKTIAAQPVVLKAIAKLVFDFKFNRRRQDNGDEQFEKLIDGLPGVDFSHENPVWRFYELSDEEREAAKIGELGTYLPDDDGANRDPGAFQEGLMRFGAKHNDIFPLIGDMIRWQVGLDNRHD